MWSFYNVLKIHSFHQNVKQCHHFSQERIELSENDDEEKRRREEIDWLGWFFLWWNELSIFQRQTRSIFYFCTFMPNLSIPGTFYNDNQRIEVINGKKRGKRRWKSIPEMFLPGLFYASRNYFKLLIVWTRCVSFWLVPYHRKTDVSFWIIIRM